jgi:membrane protease YdiL (CAAX protease family)
METNWAAEHLQVIRTLMERSAVYRRALAPIMALTGVLGLAAALGGSLAKIDSPRSFAIYWLLVSLAAIAGAFLLVRRQALKEQEAFWSPPTRRVTQALLPALMAGFILSVMILLRNGSGEQSPFEMTRLPSIWIILYGCALHAAGFFMPRGMKMFGWAFVLGGCAVFAVGIPDWPRPVYLYAHGVMGLFFGGLHLAYGIYLYFTEQGKNAT